MVLLSLVMRAHRSYAGDSKPLLQSLVVDPKSAGQCILRMADVTADAGQRMWLFGTVTTESGPRNIKARLSAT